jgi:hypothetical protein
MLATFWMTKTLYVMVVLVCSWPHSVGENHLFVMMLLNRDSAIRNAFKKFCTIYKSEKLDPLQPSGRRDIPFRPPTVQNIIRSDLPLCREALNYSSLHPFGHFSSTPGWHSVFDQLWDFFPKHRYGKIAATAPMMWIPVRTRSSIRQVSHSKSKRLDASLHGLDALATDMEIACIWSTI